MRSLKAKHKKFIFIWSVMLPVAIYYFIVYWQPVLMSIYNSLTNWTIGARNIAFIGLQNYIRAFQDASVHVAFRNTFLLTIWTVPILLILAVLFAAIVDRLNLRVRNFYITVYFLPMVTTMVVISLVWRWIMHPTMGILNYLLSLVGIVGPAWLANPNTAIIAIAIVIIWRHIGYNAIIILTGLQNIPTMYYEAASIDGASSTKQFFRITLPLLQPTLIFVAITSMIGSLTTFTQVFIMTQGRPGGMTRTVSMLIYEEGIRHLQMGYSAAISFILFVVIMTITALQMKFVNTNWEY